MNIELFRISDIPCERNVSVTAKRATKICETMINVYIRASEKLYVYNTELPSNYLNAIVILLPLQHNIHPTIPYHRTTQSGQSRSTCYFTRANKSCSYVLPQESIPVRTAKVVPPSLRNRHVRGKLGFHR